MVCVGGFDGVMEAWGEGCGAFGASEGGDGMFACGEEGAGDVGTYVAAGLKGV